MSEADGQTGDLHDFVYDALLQITTAVTKAHWDAEAPISPVVVDGVNVAKPENVNFDIAITAERKTNGGLKVVTLGELSGERTAQIVSRVSFAVPVYFGGKKLKNREEVEGL